MTTAISKRAHDKLGTSGLLEMYRRMVSIRLFETTAENLFAAGELVGSIHTSVGQEGVCVGAAMAVAADDFMTGHHRSHGHPIGKGADIGRLMAELFGKESGICHGFGGSMHLADFTIGSLGEAAIVASSMPVAVGAALASKMSGWNKVCLAFFGDGASNAGAFHESLNMAAVWKLPVIFVCENNQFAVSTRHETVCAVEHIAQRGAAYNMPAETVDGQNALAVWEAVDRAASNARANAGPALIEAMTYRYGDHSYLMNRLRYRTDEEVAAWRKNDPIDNLGHALEAENLATTDELVEIQEGVRRDVDKAVASAREASYPGVDRLWDLMYVDPTGFRDRRHHVEWVQNATSQLATNGVR